MKSEKNRLNSKERYDSILDAAAVLFAEYGYDNVTTKRLAEAAGCSEALLYRHFPGKEAIYDALFEEFRQFQNEPAVIEIVDGSYLKSLKAFYESLSTGNFIRKTSGQVRRNLVKAVRNRPSYSEKCKDAIMDGSDILKDSIEPLIRKAVENGEISTEREIGLIARAFWTMCAGSKWIASYSRKPEFLPFEELINIIF